MTASRNTICAIGRQIMRKWAKGVTLSKEELIALKELLNSMEL
jgi:hypothetical protein